MICLKVQLHANARPRSNWVEVVPVGDLSRWTALGWTERVRESDDLLQRTETLIDFINDGETPPRPRPVR